MLALAFSFFNYFCFQTMVTQEQLKNLSDRVSKLNEYLEIEKKLIEISNEEEKTADPNFWNNPKDARDLIFT